MLSVSSVPSTYKRYIEPHSRKIQNVAIVTGSCCLGMLVMGGVCCHLQLHLVVSYTLIGVSIGGTATSSASFVAVTILRSYFSKHTSVIKNEESDERDYLIRAEELIERKQVLKSRNGKHKHPKKLDQLPKDLLLQILFFLNISDYITMSEVSKKWNGMVYAEGGKLATVVRLLKQERKEWMRAMGPSMQLLFPQPEDIPTIEFEYGLPFMNGIVSDKFEKTPEFRHFKHSRSPVLKSENKKGVVFAICVQCKTQGKKTHKEMIIITLKKDKWEIIVSPQGALDFFYRKQLEDNSELFSWLEKLLNRDSCYPLVQNPTSGLFEENSNGDSSYSLVFS